MKLITLYFTKDDEGKIEEAGKKNHLNEIMSSLKNEIKKPETKSNGHKAEKNRKNKSLQQNLQGQVSFKYSEWDLNPHELKAHRILSPVRLPIPPSEQGSKFKYYFVFIKEKIELIM